MPDDRQYELIDFGEGRRLERFADMILDRPCPAALGKRCADRALWHEADARFVEKTRASGQGARGVWKALTEKGREFFPEEHDSDPASGSRSEMVSGFPWQIEIGSAIRLELRGSPFGHIGIFPEQDENWRRIAELSREGAGRLGRPIRVLNLFGYTGGSALAALSAGAETTHLDAARNVVGQAKRNALLSFGDPCPVPARWITDDAVKFVKREEKRESRYEGIILDPPTYGHGARGEVWRLARDLAPLLERCVRLLTDEFAFVMLTAHTPGYGFAVLEKMLKDAFRGRFGAVGKIGSLAKPLSLRSRSGNHLPAGDLALAVLRNER